MKRTSLAKLTVKNAQFYAYHGAKAEEKKLGGKFSVDLQVWYDDTNAVINDNVNYAVNYEELLFVVSEVMNGDSLDLIETIGNEILNMIFDKFDMVQKATVTVTKLSVPMRRIIDSVSVEQSMERPTD